MCDARRAQIRRTYERTTATGTVSSWPTIVVHYSYVFDASWNTGSIHALMDQPLAFQQRVVIGALAPFFTPNAQGHLRSLP